MLNLRPVTPHYRTPLKKPLLQNNSKHDQDQNIPTTQTPFSLQGLIRAPITRWGKGGQVPTLHKPWNLFQQTRSADKQKGPITNQIRQTFQLDKIRIYLRSPDKASYMPTQTDPRIFIQIQQKQ